MSLTIAFDVYGTLVDPRGIGAAVAPLAGDKTEAFLTLWRDKQLEYSFRRAAMRCFQPFSQCTEDALRYCCQLLSVSIKAEERQRLLSLYRQLPAFEEAGAALAELKARGARLFAFSNGRPGDLQALLEHNRLIEHLDGVISVEPVGLFKPAPEVYAHFLKESGGEIGSSWLVSSNPFDIIGAGVFGLNTAWCRRSAASCMDPWDEAAPLPTRVLSSLTELPAALEVAP